MGLFSIDDVSRTSERHKVFILSCRPDDLIQCVLSIQELNIVAVNMGKELASFIDGLDDYMYLNIDVYDFIIRLLEGARTKIKGIGNDVVAIYNLGILLEPALELKAAQLIKDFSKTTALIVIWENQSDLPDVLNWPTQRKHYNLDFSNTQIKKLQYEV